MDIDRVHCFHVFEETGSLVKAPEVPTLQFAGLSASCGDGTFLIWNGSSLSCTAVFETAGASEEPF